MKKIILFFNGIFMGAADTVPGVSGGTIALICGIYEEFISTIKSFSPKIVKSFLKRITKPEEGNKEQFKKDVASLNLPFLIPLGIGIVFALLLLSSVIPASMDRYPIQTFSVFIGLIIASIKTPFRLIENKNLNVWMLLIAGFVFAFAVSVISSGNQTSENIAFYYLFFSGFLGISAMLLPGLSGAYILMILGVYRPVLELLSEVKSNPMLVFSMEGFKLISFVVGMVVGLMVFSRILTKLLKTKRDQTMALLTGLMTGALIVPFNEMREHNLADNIFLMTAFIAVGAALVIGIDLIKNKKVKN
ncbi:DUF368 domain-containing protein [Herbivorax sp. ANBcel31]|uniref:DUF368 domain-containing protein n=1 Tax=Herbivorax sp. ANBcel31 TaxID=3069754 RepID=UPI0027B2D273|nr:DUF368 domain-containing protein [Herbivorax sp. ANBcel31]MDQ2085179.1 DUF368 domain-containing protein [Herbivorax sp. ANBcel31]